MDSYTYDITTETTLSVKYALFLSVADLNDLKIKNNKHTR